MGLIKITTEKPDELFKAPEFPVLSAGIHSFVVANDLKVTQTKGDVPKDIIKLEARCQDEGAEKGMAVFDNFMLITTTTDEKSEQAKKIHDAKLAQFIVACGVMSAVDVASGKEFDLADLKGKIFQAETKVGLVDVYPEELDDAGKPKKVARASIKKYLFDGSK
jgi:hypothetical protein